MKNEDKTKAELIKELKTLRKEREKSALNDFTERKQTEEVIQESESRLRELFKHMSSGVAIYEAKDNGKDFIIKDFNRAAEKIEKVKKEDIIEKNVLKVFPGVKDFGLFKVFQEVYKTGMPQHHPISLYKDQRITGWRENYIYKLPSGEIVAVYDDITERKKAEEQIKDSEERLKILFDYAPDAYYISDLKGNFIDGNLAAERVIGYKREELIGSSFLKLKLLSLADAAKAAKLLVKNLRGQPTGPDEFILNRKDKSKVTVEISTYPVKIKGRTLVLGIARDITERKQAEEEIRLHAAMMDNVAEGVYLIGLDDLLIKWANEKFARMFGYDPGEMVGKHVDIVNAPTERTPTETRIAIVDVLKETGEWHGEVKNIKRDGTHFWCYANVSLFEHPEHGKVIVAVHTDITKRKQAEEKTRQKTEDLALVNALNNAVNRDDSLLEILQLLARETKRIFSCYGATVYLLSEDREHLVMQTLTLPSVIISRVEKLTGIRIPAISIPIKARSLYRKVLQDSKPQLINDPKTIQGLMAEFTENKILKKLIPKIYSILDTRSLINIPLVSKDEAIGLLDISRKEPFTEFDLKRVEAISGQLTSILERKKAEEKIKHLNLVLRAIRRVNQLIVREKNRERLLKGVCNNLIETRGYYNTWIVLLDEEGKLKTCAEAGLGKDFLPMIELLKRGKLTTCSQKALKQQEVVITENPASTCTECPLAQEYSGRGAMTIRLEHSGRVYGLMTVSIPANLAVDQEEQTLFKEVAEDIAFSIYNIELDEKRKQAEQELSKEKTLLKTIIDKIPVLLTRYDPDTNMLYLNKEFEKIVGWKTEEVKDIDLMEKVYPDPNYRKQAMEYMQKASTEWREFRVQSKSGKIINSEWSNIRLDDGTQIGIGINITARKLAEEEIKSAAAKWQTTFDAMNDAVSLIDNNGIVLQCNQSYLNLLGKTETEILGKHCWEIVHGTNKPIDGCPIVKMKKSFQRESMLLPIEDKWFNVVVDPIFDVNNNLINAVHIMTDITERKQAEERLKKTMDATIETVSKIIEAKDPYTAGHQLRVSQLTTAIAKELNLSQDKIKGIRVASLIHDIGKISVPTEILSKSIALSDIEFSLIKGHSQIGYDILKSIEFPWPVEEIILQHHERLNGSGYPQGLKADKIMTEAKIIGVADVVEAMSSHRPYRPALGIDAALEEISKNRGILYDPEIVDVCLRLFKEKRFKFE